MPAAFVLARAGLRRRLGPLIGISVVLALGIGVAIASSEAAARTERAYPSYLRGSEVAELVVNPGLNTARAEEVIASTPGIRSYASDSLLTAIADRGDLSSQAESDATQVLVSADGRFTKQDRPVVHQGRMIRSGAEAFVNVEMADALGLRVGETVPLAFARPSYSAPKKSVRCRPAADRAGPARTVLSRFLALSASPSASSDHFWPVEARRDSRGEEIMRQCALLVVHWVTSSSPV